VRSQQSVGWLLLPERFDDDGYSGATTDRPALEGLLALARDGCVDRVVIHRLDRLARSVLARSELFREFRKFGVGVVVVAAPELGGSAQDGFMLNILASFAEFERELIAGRIAESRARLKARGLRIAGALPFGYDAEPRPKQLKPNTSESAVVKWMFEQAAAGQTPAEIADGANASGWRTKKTTARGTARTRRGNLWTARQVIATLRNPCTSVCSGKSTISGLAITRRLSRTNYSLPPQLGSRRVERGRRESITRSIGLCRGESRARPASGRCRRTRFGIESLFIVSTGGGQQPAAASLRPPGFRTGYRS